MTQPVYPSLLPQNAPSLLTGGAPGAPLPVAPQGARALLEQRAAQGAFSELDERKRVEEEAARQHAASQARWGDGRGAAATGLTYFTKGVLDVVLAPGALLGATLEGVGWLADSEGLEDFGRDLGRASSGREALSALTAAPEALSALASTPDRARDRSALHSYESARKDLAAQAEAWPLLSTVSALAGEAATGLALGGLATGAKGLVGVAAFEGASGGAQTAYERSASYRDVLAAAGTGALLATGLAWGGEAAVGALQRRGARIEAARSAFGEVAEAETKAAARTGAKVPVDKAGGREAQSVISELEAARETAHKAVKAAGDNPIKRQSALQEALGTVRAELAEKAGKFQPERWTSQTPTPLQRVLYRTELLDRIADDVATAASHSIRTAPDFSFQVSPKHLTRVLKNADGPAAIGSLQQRIAAGIQEAPHTELAGAVVTDLRATFARLAEAELPEAFVESHKLSQRLMAVAARGDELTAAYAKRQAGSLAQTLSSESFGTAGKLYGDALQTASERAAKLADAKLVREALRTADLRGNLPAIAREHSDTVARALDAQAKLAGRSAPTAAVADLHELERLLTKAEEAATLDGGPVRRVVDWFRNKAEDKAANAVSAAVGGAIGGYPGAAAGYLVSSFLRPRMGSILGAVRNAARRGGRGIQKAVARTGKPANEYLQALASDLGENATLDTMATIRPSALSGRAVAQKEKHAQFEARTAALARLSTDTSALDQPLQALDSIIPSSSALAAAEIAGKMQTLIADWPKSSTDFRGRSSGKSSDEIRKASAMWEATFDPGSVFEELAAGRLDPEKARYVWKQYPGLKQAAQMALLDVFHNQLSEEELAAVPETVVSQLDRFLDLEGALQETLRPEFVQAVTAIAEQAASKQKPTVKKPLDLPTSRPTPMQRISGQRKG